MSFLKFFVFLVISQILLTNCSQNISEQEAIGNTSEELVENRVKPDNKNLRKTTIDNLTSKVNLDGSIGVITLNKTSYDKSKFIQIYNQDRSLWYKFTFYYDDSDGQFEYENKEFAPFSFHPDYFTLAMTCIEELEDKYKVIVNEKTGLEKFVKKDDVTLKFESWKEYVLKASSVKFDKSKNPIRDSSQGRVKEVNFSEKAEFVPVKINGNWLKIEWKKDSTLDNEIVSGWIKWKENSDLVVELYYLD